MINGIKVNHKWLPLATKNSLIKQRYFAIIQKIYEIFRIDEIDNYYIKFYVKTL